jgi:hypothetical protein
MSSTEIGIEQARKVLGDLATRAQLTGQITYLTRNGRRVAAIVPLESIMTTITMTPQAAEIIATALIELGATTHNKDVAAAAHRVAELHERTAQQGLAATHDEAHQLHYEIMQVAERDGELNEELRLIAELAESGAALGSVISYARTMAADTMSGSPRLTAWLDRLSAALAA